jgi:hypothetical protein
LKQKGHEVLYVSEPIDEMTLQNIEKFSEKVLYVYVYIRICLFAHECTYEYVCSKLRISVHVCKDSFNTIYDSLNAELMFVAIISCMKTIIITDLFKLHLLDGWVNRKTS